MIKIIVSLVLWFFTLTGAIIVSKICLWAIKQQDITYVLTGGFIMITTWFVIASEVLQIIKKIKIKK
jgi:hypothetical protein